MKITSTQNQVIKELVKLSQKKHRDRSSEILVEGWHLIEEARKANLLKTTMGLEHADIEISESVSQKLSQTKSGSSIFGVVQKPHHTLEKGMRYLVCDGVQDPGNVGTLIRSAHSFGFDAVILSKDSADEFNDKTLRSSQGAVFHIPVLRMELQDAYRFFKDNNVKVYATHVDNESVLLESVNLNDAIAVVMGSEGSGVSALSLANASSTLHIPTANFESLNVAVAGGIICYYLKK